jgi:glycerophosphoryl diester phosphodiesterase
MVWAIAHRGYSARYPENTLLAFEKAIEVGSDYIETDLRLSRDGVIVCCHDATLERIAGDSSPIAEIDLTELRAVSLPQGQHVPTLKEVFNQAKGRARILLDIKTDTREILPQVFWELRHTGIEVDVMLGIRHLAHLDFLGSQTQPVRVLGLVANYDDVPAFLERGVSVIRVWEEDLTSELQRVVKERDRQIWITAGLRSKGDDGIMLNDPALVTRQRSETIQKTTLI